MALATNIHILVVYMYCVTRRLGAIFSEQNQFIRHDYSDLDSFNCHSIQNEIT